MLGKDWSEQYMNDIIIFNKNNNAVSIPIHDENSVKKPIEFLINYLSSFEDRASTEIFNDIEFIIKSKTKALIREGLIRVVIIQGSSTYHSIEDIQKNANAEELVWVTNGEMIFSFSSESIVAHVGTIQDLLDSGYHLGQYPLLQWDENKIHLEKRDQNTLAATNEFKKAIVEHGTTFYPEMLTAVAEYLYYLFVRSDRKDIQFKDITVKEFSEKHVHMNISKTKITADEILKRLIAKIFTEGFSSNPFPKLINEFPDEFNAFFSSSIQSKRIAIGSDTIPDMFNVIIDIPSIHDLIMQQIDEVHEKVKGMSFEFLLAMGKRAK